MERAPKSSPRDVFLHLLGFASLYVSAIALIALLFAYTDYSFPDRLEFYLIGSLDQIRWTSSVLMIVFPVFMLISWTLGKDFAINPEKRNLRFRKWLIYFTLFVAAVTIMVDLIILVFNFYSGELTVKFFWKVLVVLMAAAGVFGYYRWELGRSSQKMVWPRIFAGVAAGVVTAVLVTGFFMVGSPTTQRARRFDERRVNDLQTIQSQIISYWQQKEKLPENLTDLKNDWSGFVPPADPETGRSYEYIVAGLNFQLCAEFGTDGQFGARGREYPKSPLPYEYQQNWNHDSGRVCFQRAIDPELYDWPEKRKIPSLR